MWGYTVQHSKYGQEVVESCRYLEEHEVEGLFAFLSHEGSDEKDQLGIDLAVKSSQERRWVKVCFCGTCTPGSLSTLIPVYPTARQPHFRRGDEGNKAGCKLTPERKTGCGPRVTRRSECAPVDLSLFLRSSAFSDAAAPDTDRHVAPATADGLFVARSHHATLRTLMSGLSHLARHDEIINLNDGKEALQIRWPEQRMRHAARGIVDTRGCGLCLDDLLFLPRSLPYNSAMLMHELAAQVEAVWQGKGDPLGYAMFSASTIERGGSESRIVDADPANPSVITLPHWVRVPVRGDLEGEGPFLVLLKCCWSRRAGWYFAASYAHPILRRNVWMQVDARGERHTALALYWIREGLKKRGIHVRVFKPMFDRFVGEWGVRPDFELELTLGDGSSRLLLIETMGSRHSKYLQGKRAPHQRMRKLGELVEDWRLRDMTPENQRTANKQLRDTVFAWISNELCHAVY